MVMRLRGSTSNIRGMRSRAPAAAAYRQKIVGHVAKLQYVALLAHGVHAALPIAHWRHGGAVLACRYAYLVRGGWAGYICLP